MSIYFEERTGRFRVEIEGPLGRYRCRCATMPEAKRKERDFRSLKERGVVPPQAKRPDKALTTRGGVKLSEARKSALGVLWKGCASEGQNIAKLDAIIEVMGDVELDSIDAAWIEDLKVKLPKAHKRMQDCTVNRYLAALSKLLEWSIDKKFRSVPALPRIRWNRENQHRIRWITPEEQSELEARTSESVSNLIGVAIRTGMRRGELLTLERRQVRQGWVDLWKTKTDAPRSIPITEADHEALAWLLERNRMPSIMDLRGEWRRARKAMGLDDDEEFVFHACRHTCATRLVMANVNLRIIQRFMGHKDIKTTLRYAQVNDTMLTDALTKLGELNGGLGRSLSERPAPLVPVQQDAMMPVVAAL